ncbi:MAG: MFS transporter [Marinibacterium sp.]|nr:MFS transporter [Marinibacterium sp.]
MFSVLSNRTYRHLLSAQIVALLGTGLATVALGLLAWDLAGGDAGRVLGTALAIKMVAYVTLSPLAQALTSRIPRRRWLVACDLIRACVALALPFVTEIWQIYLLIFLLQAASAGFTPAFQATIPDVLTDEDDYTKALSLSRLAYDLESLVSPMLAAALLSVVSFDMLFAGTVIGFLASALLVVSVRLPTPGAETPRPFRDRLTLGVRIFLATPRLRGLLALNLCVAAAGSMVIVNTVVLVKGPMARGEHAVAIALAAFGAGSMLAALALPRLMQQIPDRAAMLTGAALLTLGAGVGPLADSYGALLGLWAVLGFGFSIAQLPAGRLLRRSAHAEDRPALFATQFALSHAAWLVCYPLAGWLGAGPGLDAAFVVLALLAAVGLGLAVRLWPGGAPADLPHSHDDLPPDHPHLQEHARQHAHPVIIDDLHPRWPG